MTKSYYIYDVWEGHYRGDSYGCIGSEGNVPGAVSLVGRGAYYVITGRHEGEDRPEAPVAARIIRRGTARQLRG